MDDNQVTETEVLTNSCSPPSAQTSNLKQLQRTSGQIWFKWNEITALHSSFTQLDIFKASSFPFNISQEYRDISTYNKETRCLTTVKITGINCCLRVFFFYSVKTHIQDDYECVRLVCKMQLDWKRGREEGEGGVNN